MSLYKLKPWFRKKLSNITYRLWINHYSPNQVTLFAIISSIIYGVLMLHTQWDFLFLFFPIFVIFRMALNAIDGLMASTYNMKSKLGFYLNEAGDIISDFFIYLPFSFFMPFYLYLPFAILTALTEIIGVSGLYFTKERYYHGPLGKSDRVLVFSILSLFIFFNDKIPYVSFTMSIVLILLAITCYNRWRANYV